MSRVVLIRFLPELNFLLGITGLLVHSGHPLLGFGDLPPPPGTFSDFVAGMYTHFSSVWIVLPGLCLL